LPTFRGDLRLVLPREQQRRLETASRKNALTTL
jgi:hypothetical protein